MINMINMKFGIHTKLNMADLNKAGNLLIDCPHSLNIHDNCQTYEGDVRLT